MRTERRIAMRLVQAERPEIGHPIAMLYVVHRAAQIEVVQHPSSGWDARLRIMWT